MNEFDNLFTDEDIATEGLFDKFKNNNSKDTKPKAGHTYVNVDIVERNKEDLLSRQNHWILLNNVKVRKNKNSWKLRADSWSPIDS